MDTSKGVVANYSDGHLTKENISPDKVNDVLHKKKEVIPKIDRTMELCVAKARTVVKPSPPNLNTDPATDNNENDDEGNNMTIKQKNITAAVAGDGSTDL